MLADHIQDAQGILHLAAASFSLNWVSTSCSAVWLYSEALCTPFNSYCRKSIPFWTLCLESCHTYCCWDHQACQRSCHNILPGLKIASPNNPLSIVSWSFLCVQRYTEDFCTSFGSPVTSWTACERSAVKQSVTQHGRQTPTGTVSEQNTGTRAAREGWSVLPFICCI